MNSLFFIVVGAVALAAALGVLLSRQPVHSALFLMANFGSLAVLYVTLDAQFLAAAQVIIYAGGIVKLVTPLTADGAGSRSSAPCWLCYFWPVLVPS